MTHHDAKINGFRAGSLEVDGIAIAYEVAGTGPPLLLLHGYPQHRGMWRQVAPALAQRFTVVAADLRGYGQSSAPPGDPAHERYSKRAMAGDQVALMSALDFDRFAVCGHDRGGRVTHRMCLDHPDRVAAACVVDIVPTKYLFDGTDMAFAMAYYHWFFLAQAPDLPERLIGAAPDHFLRTTLNRWSGPGFAFSDEEAESYVNAFTPDIIHASCEDYRAAASIDLEHDRSDTSARIACPLLVLWGELGAMHRLYDVPETWRNVATDVSAAPIRSGHFVPEEAPQATVDALIRFLDPIPTW